MPGTGRARRESSSSCQGPGAPALRGSQRRLPCTHQRGNLHVPPRAAPSQLETLKAALAPGVGWAGLGWVSPRTSPPRCAELQRGSPVLPRNFSELHLHPPGADREKEDPPLQRGRGSCWERLLPLHRIPKDHSNIVPNSTRGERGEQSSQGAPSPDPGQEGPTSGCSCPSTTLLCSSPLPPHPQGRFYVGGDFLFQTRFPFLTPPSQPRASPALAPLLPQVLERLNNPCVGKDRED